ncbi:MAG: hypothetical protein JWR50_808 [Mucilaginibacter sp.]|nr:hypothetical protein [Mucilaginibacter sp.]
MLCKLRIQNLIHYFELAMALSQAYEEIQKPSENSNMYGQTMPR